MLVMVVLVVLCLLATFILSFSVRNLKSQVDSVSQLQEKYHAQAEIEKIVATLESMIGTEEADIALNSTEIDDIKVEIQVQEEYKEIQIISSCGAVRVYTTLKLDCRQIIDPLMDAEDTYKIFNLAGVSYTTYGYTISGGGGE